MRIDEFGPVIGIDPPQGKRQLQAQRLEGLLHADLTLAHDGAGLDPRGVDIGQIQRLENVTIRAIPRVTDEVHFGEARLGDVPVIGLDRNVVFQ